MPLMFYNRAMVDYMDVTIPTTWYDAAFAVAGGISLPALSESITGTN
jgi:hypothetical protein